jgi:hypothetical protein
LSCSVHVLTFRRSPSVRGAVVCFNLVPSFLGATIRQFGFLLRGLREGVLLLCDCVILLSSASWRRMLCICLSVEAELKHLGIPFVFMHGNPVVNVSKLLADGKFGLLVSLRPHAVIPRRIIRTLRLHWTYNMMRRFVTFPRCEWECSGVVKWLLPLQFRSTRQTIDAAACLSFSAYSGRVCGPRSMHTTWFLCGLRLTGWSMQPEPFGPKSTLSSNDT